MLWLKQGESGTCTSRSFWAYAIHNLRSKPDRLSGRYRNSVLERGPEICGNAARLGLVAAQQMDMDLIGAEACPVGGILGRDIDVPQAGKPPGAEDGAQIAEALHGKEDGARKGRAGLRPVDGVDVAAPGSPVPVPEARLGLGSAGARYFEGCSMNQHGTKIEQ